MKKLKVGDVVIAPEGCAECLTVGKEYEVVWVDIHSYAFRVVNDKGDKIYCRQIRCAFLNFKDWIIKQKTNTKTKKTRP